MADYLARLGNWPEALAAAEAALEVYPVDFGSRLILRPVSGSGGPRPGSQGRAGFPAEGVPGQGVCHRHGAPRSGRPPAQRVTPRRPASKVPAALGIVVGGVPEVAAFLRVIVLIASAKIAAGPAVARVRPEISPRAAVACISAEVAAAARGVGALRRALEIGTWPVVGWRTAAKVAARLLPGNGGPAEKVAAHLLSGSGGPAEEVAHAVEDQLPAHCTGGGSAAVPRNVPTPLPCPAGGDG